MKREIMSDRRVDRRRLLGAAAAGAALNPLAALASPSRAAPARAESRRTSTTLRWFGTSGWRMEIGDETLLVDPYLSRYDTGLFTGAFNPATPLTVDRELVDRYAGRPQTILVTHSHWDHFNDVPHIATSTGARVVGTLTTYHLGTAMGVPGNQLSPVKGGEVLDFGGYTVEVVASLHSRNRSYSMAFPGVRVAQPESPRTIADLPEGDTLAYLVTVKGGLSVFFMGGSDFVARNVAGLKPDVAMVAMPSSDSTYDYVPRLIDALDRVAVVVPVHWDVFEAPLANPVPATPSDRRRLDEFVAAVRRASPETRIVVPEYLTPYTF